MNIEKKKVLVIGSGNDLNGRRWGKLIDSSNRWDIVIRCNKHYGAELDVGTRMDIYATRYLAWLYKFFKTTPATLKKVIAFNEARGCSWGEQEAVAAECGVKRCSCGVLACAWALNRGAAHVDVIGFGAPGGIKQSKEKIYDSGKVDKNPNYDWTREFEWLKQNVTLL